jgi:hypothetical protein
VAALDNLRTDNSTANRRGDLHRTGIHPHGQATNVAELDRSYSSVLQQVGYQTVSAPAGTGWLRVAMLLATIATFVALAVNRNLPV